MKDINYEIPSEQEIFEAYTRKNRAYSRVQARKIKRALQQIAY